MTAHERGIFRYIDPPDQIALQQCIDAINDCSYPWERCLPELDLESQGKVNVVWGDAGQNVTGTYHKFKDDMHNVITLNTRYQVTSYAFTMLHEAGHMVDDTALRDDQRIALVKKWHNDLEGRWDGDPNVGVEWGHERPHTHAIYNGGWTVRDAHYYHRPNEAFADAFVAAFAPAHFPYPRFAHWSSDFAGIRAIVLSTPTPPKPPVSTFPNDSIYRLYRAVFLREPDKGGYDYWKSRLAAGMKLIDIANGFTNSTEFRNRYGSLSNTQFVTLLYQNVLGRAPDKSGLDHWVGFLNRGASRGEVVTGFSESQEFINKINAERKL